MTIQELQCMTIEELRTKAPARLTLKQVQAILGISQPTLWRWRQDGRVPGIIKIGHRVRVKRDELLDWMTSQNNDLDDE